MAEGLGWTKVTFVMSCADAGPAMASGVAAMAPAKSAVKIRLFSMSFLPEC
jgi:hypothetical protein